MLLGQAAGQRHCTVVNTMHISCHARTLSDHAADMIPSISHLCLLRPKVRLKLDRVWAPQHSMLSRGLLSPL